MILIISASPNTDGLTAACVEAAMQGCADAGLSTRHINLCQMTLSRCRQCDNGWGQCMTEHRCIIEDDLPIIHDALQQCTGLIMVTPVYWGEMSESAKCVFDRLRRCEAVRGTQSQLKDVPVIAIAAAGGSGGGTTSCLASMERIIYQVHARIVDLIGITQRNRPYTLTHIREAAQTMGQ